MTKLLFQGLHRPNRSPSQRYRFDQFLPFLTQNGIEVEYSELIDEAADLYFYQPKNYLKKAKLLISSILKRWKECRQASEYELALVQRESFMLGTAFFEKQLAKRLPLIFDFDDAIWQTVVSAGNKALSFLKNGEKTAEIIRSSAEIWAGNDYLADYARQYNANVRVIPTVVDTNFYQPQPKTGANKPICIGWSGSFSTVEHFQHIAPALAKLKKQLGDKICFKLIGDEKYRNPELELQGIAWGKDTELQELAGVDIGLMPLPDDQWTRGKCGLKALVYMSLAIPTVVSPVGVNQQIVQHQQDGLHASSEQDWVDALVFLVENEQERRRLGAAGRLKVQEKYSVSAWQQPILDRILSYGRK